MTAAALNTSRSDALFTAAQQLMPGGVNSPVRAFRSVGGQPIVFDRVEGAYAWDVDGNRYIDYIGSWGPAICGHANPEVIEALQQALTKTYIGLDFIRFKTCFTTCLYKSFQILNRFFQTPVAPVAYLAHTFRRLSFQDQFRLLAPELRRLEMTKPVRLKLIAPVHETIIIIIIIMIRSS